MHQPIKLFQQEIFKGRTHESDYKELRRIREAEHRSILGNKPPTALICSLTPCYSCRKAAETPSRGLSQPREDALTQTRS